MPTGHFAWSEAVYSAADRVLMPIPGKPARRPRWAGYYKNHALGNLHMHTDTASDGRDFLCRCGRGARARTKWRRTIAQHAQAPHNVDTRRVVEVAHQLLDGFRRNWSEEPIITLRGKPQVAGANFSGLIVPLSLKNMCTSSCQGSIKI